MIQKKSWKVRRTMFTAWTKCKQGVFFFFLNPNVLVQNGNWSINSLNSARLQNWIWDYCPITQLVCINRDLGSNLVYIIWHANPVLYFSYSRSMNTMWHLFEACLLSCTHEIKWVLKLVRGNRKYQTHPVSRGWGLGPGPGPFSGYMPRLLMPLVPMLEALWAASAERSG